MIGHLYKSRMALAMLLPFTLFFANSMAAGQVVNYDFSTSDHEWIPAFADYPVGAEEFYELKAEYRPRPLNLGGADAWFISGNNHSDDLFMFLKKEVTGLLPNTPYQVEVDVEFASSIPTGLVGVGGSPGDSVYVKAGVSAEEPIPVASDDFYLLNIDKGNQSNGGENASVLGTIAKQDSTLPVGFELISQMTPSPISALSNDDGSLWLMVGTDSAFEATTSLYYTQVSANFNAVPEPSGMQMAISFLAIGWMSFGRLRSDRSQRLSSYRLRTKVR